MALGPHIALRFVTEGFLCTISLRMQKRIEILLSATQTMNEMRTFYVEWIDLMHVTLCTMQICCATCGDSDRRCA